ncbi:MAG: aromatic aminobenezylarsenical efflux permease ArsG family transporter [Candidatus Pacebacteria bacterium]|nr:aromatic aminobenezylarsenical efflux permease ArsG family transporter [Candidatus Paceibacterota bacterium]
MIDFINYLIDSYQVPFLTAFLLGILTSINPCPLATNIAAIAYISKDVKDAKKSLLNGIFYTVGRGLSYTLIASLIYFGFSEFDVSKFFRGWGDKALGPILILVSLFMFGLFKINFKIGGEKLEKVKLWLSDKGYLGSLLLGMLFALTFCPYSGVIFFGILVPLIIKSSSGLVMPLLFALGTGLPVIMFSFFVFFGAKKINNIFKSTQKFELIMRYFMATVFLVTGLYYLKYLLN